MTLSILCLCYYVFFVTSPPTYYTWVFCLEYLPFYGILVYELIKGPILQPRSVNQSQTIETSSQ